MSADPGTSPIARLREYRDLHRRRDALILEGRAAGFSQRQLAIASGLHRDTVRRIAPRSEPPQLPKSPLRRLREIGAMLKWAENLHDERDARIHEARALGHSQREIAIAAGISLRRIQQIGQKPDHAEEAEAVA